MAPLVAEGKQFLKSLGKRSLFALTPRFATALMSARSRAYSQRLVKEWGLFEINQRLISEVGSRVLSGPFRGLELTPMTWEEHIGPYLIGTYEIELESWWEQVFKGSFDMIIDVGAKFGYYAVGLALKFPRAATIAFDTDWWARDAMLEMATANHVHNMSVEGYCSPRWLKENLKGNAFIISDCEGFEGELFCAIDAGAMASTTLLIELHEDAAPGVTSRIESHFARTHEARKVSSRPTTLVPGHVQIRSLSEEEIRRASSEIRPRQEWLFLSPNSGTVRDQGRKSKSH